MYATKEYVSRVETRLNMSVRMIKEDIDAVGGTVVKLLEGQQRLETKVDRTDANVRAIMDHLGAPAVAIAEPAETENP